MSPESNNHNILFSENSSAEHHSAGHVHLNFYDVKWNGTISSLDEHGLCVRVDGFIPITVSQKALVTLNSEKALFKIKGRVATIQVQRKPDGHGHTSSNHMNVHLSWPELDEFSLYKMTSLLKTHASKLEYWLSIDFSAENQQEDAPHHLVSTHGLGSPLPSTDLPELATAIHPKLVSSLFEFQNDDGYTIVGYHDHHDGTPADAPVVIMTPGYGETKREYITLAYYLASNGFQVLRYDHTHHVGESEGSHEQTSLMHMKHDMAAMLTYADTFGNAKKKVLIATSLSGRVALKVLAEGDYALDQLIVISGIVDVRSTLTAVHQEDLIGGYLNGHGRGLTNVLGYTVDGRIFLRDAVEGGFADLPTTIRDAQSISVPVLWFSAEHDAWVDPSSLQRVQEALSHSPCRSFVIPEGLHRLQENPRMARTVYRHIVFACQEQLHWRPNCGELIEPARKDIGQQNKIERERNKVRRFQQEADHVNFWSNYLANFHYIANSHDYLAALDHIYHVVGPLSPGERVLDAGCGNGHFGSFLLAKEWTRHQQPRRSAHAPIQYVGVDFVESAIGQARKHLHHVFHQTIKNFQNSIAPSAFPILHPTFYRLDLNKPLPFKDNSFDRIVSNLVIGYLHDPEASIRELLRVLAPGGKMVLTNLKPCSDLTQIYRNFVDHTTAESEIYEAREVLNNSSHIRQGESEGAFQFYTQKEFHAILQASGALNPRVFPTFGNQAYLGVVEKPSLPAMETPRAQWTGDSLIAA